MNEPYPASDAWIEKSEIVTRPSSELGEIYTLVSTGHDAPTLGVISLDAFRLFYVRLGDFRGWIDWVRENLLGPLTLDPKRLPD